MFSTVCELSDDTLYAVTCCCRLVAIATHTRFLEMVADVACLPCYSLSSMLFVPSFFVTLTPLMFTGADNHSHYPQLRDTSYMTSA